MNLALNKKTFTKLIISFAILTFLSPLVLQADFLNKDKREEYDSNINATTIDTGISTERSLDDLIGSVIRVILASLGSIFLVLMVLAGNEWMRAAGNQDKIRSSQKKIASLLIGLVLVLSAYALSYWISSIFARVLAN